MNSFTLALTTHIFFGRNPLPLLTAKMHSDGITRVAVLRGGEAVVRIGLWHQVMDALRYEGIETVEISGIQPNPRLRKTEEIIASLRTQKLQALVPVGGGSVFDTAKAVAAGLEDQGNLWDFFSRTRPLVKALPLYGVLSASATSSEYNSIAVITNEEHQDKWSISAPCLQPRTAAIDPRWQFSLPESQTVNGGIDIMAHILEAYCEGSTTYSVVTEHCEAHLRAMLRVLPHLRRYPDDEDARSEMALTGLFGHSGIFSMGRTNRGEMSSHRIEHALSAVYDVPHGAGLSVLMPAWADFVASEGQAIFERLGRVVLGLPESASAHDAIAALRDFFASLGAPVSLRELNIGREDIPMLAQITSRLGPCGTLRSLGLEEIRQIYENAW